MLLLPARVHVDRRRALIAMKPFAHEEPPEPVTVECLRCWPSSVTHALARAMQRAGLPRVRLHYLRHYFISFLPQLEVLLPW
jgi:integrase